MNGNEFGICLEIWLGATFVVTFAHLPFIHEPTLCVGRAASETSSLV